MFPGADASRLRAELAVMHVFRHLGVPADVFLPVDEIAKQGAACGVRVGDMTAAIDRLIKRGFLARSAESTDQVTCTVAGVNWFDDQPGWLEYHLLMPRIARARYLRQFGERALGGAARRRSGERVIRSASA